jgi:hypothetical protein
VQTLVDILAGGPGSGCHGPRCGRPGGTQHFTTHSGATYTIFKPSRKGIAKGQHSVKDTLKKADKLKGQYKVATVDMGRGRSKQLEDVEGREKGGGKAGRLASVYDAKYGRGDVYENHGTTVFVHRDFANKRVVVHEIPHDDMNKSATMKAFKFRNFGQAAGFLNKRYGITQKLPRQTMDAAATESVPKWMHDLVENFSPEQIEKLFSVVYDKYGQAFSIEDVEVDGSQVLVELKDGKRLHVVL